jgi:cytochrome c biogenesis factor
MASLNALGLLQETLIQANTIKTSDESKLFVNLISFISIGVITLIGIFTFPLLGKIEDRKISVLKFFNMLNIEQITELVQRGKDFQVEFEAINGQYKASA